MRSATSGFVRTGPWLRRLEQRAAQRPELCREPPSRAARACLQGQTRHSGRPLASPTDGPRARRSGWAGQPCWASALFLHSWRLRSCGSTSPSAASSTTRSSSTLLGAASAPACWPWTWSATGPGRPSCCSLCRTVSSTASPATTGMPSTMSSSCGSLRSLRWSSSTARPRRTRCWRAPALSRRFYFFARSCTHAFLCKWSVSAA